MLQRCLYSLCIKADLDRIDQQINPVSRHVLSTSYGQGTLFELEFMLQELSFPIYNLAKKIRPIHA